MRRTISLSFRQLLRGWAASVFGLLVLCPCFGAEPLNAWVRLVRPEQFARGPVELQAPSDGALEVWVWDVPGREWTARVNGSQIELLPEASDRAGHPAWRQVGSIECERGKPIQLQVAGLSLEPPKMQADYRTQEKRLERAASNRVPPLVALRAGEALDLNAPLNLARGRVDRTDAPPDLRRENVRTLHDSTSFEPSSDPALHALERDRLRDQLRVALGLFPTLPRTPLNPAVTGTIEQDGYVIEKVAIETLPGYILTGVLYRPTGREGRLPTVINPHGHAEVGRLDPDTQFRCIHLAKLGMIAFAYDMVGYNDAASFGHRTFDSPRLEQWGLSLFMLQTWNSMRVLDYLCSRPDVDPTRIGCTGASGGGTQTYSLAALDQRVAVAAPVVMVGELYQGGCICENAPGLRWDTNNVAIASLIAPRPLLLVGATGDWTVNTSSRVKPAIAAVYEQFGRRDQFDAVTYDFPHNYNRTSRNAVYHFMAPRLLGHDGEFDEAEDAYASLPNEQLLVYPDRPLKSPALLSPHDLETALIAQRRGQIERLQPGEDPVAWQLARDQLERCRAIRTGIRDAVIPDLGWYSLRKQEMPIGTLDHLVILRRDTDERIPAAILRPAHPTGQTTILFTEHGKAVLAENDTAPARLVQALAERGQTLILFDAFLTGEAVDSEHFATRRPTTDHFDCYNRSLAADRMRDLQTVVAWAIRQMPGTQLNLFSEQSFAPLALIALPGLPGVNRVWIDLDGQDDSEESAAAVGLPGFFQFGGLTACAALSAPRSLSLTRPGPALDQTWANRAYDMAGVPGLLRIDSSQAPEVADAAQWLCGGFE